MYKVPPQKCSRTIPDGIRQEDSTKVNVNSFFYYFFFNYFILFSERATLSIHNFVMHFKVSPKSVFVLSNILKRARVSYESAKSALLLSKVLIQQKRGWSLIAHLAPHI